MPIMSKFFKKEEKKPISFASVEMQKAPKNYTKWIIAIISIILIVAIYFGVR
jgi:hypothetical protein